jgi:anti-sigma B factor antagonist
VERSSGAAPLRQGGSDRNGGAPLEVRVEDTGNGASIVALAGELDLSTIGRMQAPLFEQLSQRPAVVVDLTRLSFIDSTGIGILIKGYQMCSNGSRMHVVIGHGSQIDRVFRIAGLDRSLPLFYDRDEAFGALT